MISLATCVCQCQKCPETVIVPDWIPISYFGDYQRANSWVLAINPSDREFLDKDGQVLTGDRQRFRRLADFHVIDRRQELGPRQVESVLEYQDTIFDRVPYRPFFNKLGRFLSALHCNDTPTDPLMPFQTGITSRAGQTFHYAHLDIIKCATKYPWSRLSSHQQTLLFAKCQPFLEQQLMESEELKLILLNGRTVLNHSYRFLAERFGYEPTRMVLDLGDTSSELWLGNLQLASRSVAVVGWSANVVNSHLTKSALETLVRKIRSSCPVFC